MEFYPGFAWAVPRAFAAAVQACRFEQGDVLYDDRSAYADPGGVGAPGHASKLRYHIQVLEPARSTRALSGESEGRRFQVNWDSPVRFELTDLRDDRLEEIESTQGRLFTCLWTGDRGWLDRATGESASPPLPRLQRELHGLLDEALPATRSSLSKARWAQCVFVMAVDRSSDAARVKVHQVGTVLAAHFRSQEVELSPIEAGVSDAQCFHPALVVWAAGLECPNLDAVRDVLKSVLYSRAGGAEAAADEAPKKDRFNVASHGLLAKLG